MRTRITMAISIVTLIVLAVVLFIGAEQQEPRTVKAPIESNAEAYRMYLLIQRLEEIAKKNEFTDEQVRSIQEYLKEIANEPSKP